MKVLIVNKFLYPNGGSETYIFKLGEELVRQGHEVQYFGMEHEGRIVGNHAEVYTDNMDFHTGKLQKLLYPFKIIYSKEAARKITKVLEDFKPDVVHLNNFNFQLTPSIIYATRKWEKKRGHKVKIVYTAHDSMLVCPGHLMQQYISHKRCDLCVKGSVWNCAKYKCIHGSKVKSILGSVEGELYRKLKTYRLIDAVICPSEFLKRQLDSNAVLKGKTRVINNFIEKATSETQVIYDAFANCDSISEATYSGDSYITYVGRYSEEKGIKTLLEAAKRLPNIKFIFAGSGPLENEINAISNIENRGFLTPEAAQGLMAGAKALVFPSECNENYPFTVAEAMLNGTPVIGTNIGGVPEQIKDGVNGLLFEAGNVEELVSKIELIQEDTTLLKKLADGAGDTKYMTLEEYTKKLVKEIY